MIKKIVRKDFKMIDKNEEISKIFGYLYENAFFPIIMDEKKPWGIIDVRRLLKRKLKTNEKIKNFVVGVPKIDASYSISKARETMLKSGQPVIIVTFGGKLVGYVNAIDIASQIGIKKAEDIMKYVEPIEENETISSAINMLKRRNMSVLPVVKNKKFLGVIRIRDLIKIETTHEKKTDYHSEKTSPLDAPIKGFIESGIRVVEPDDIEKIIKIVDKQGFAVVCKNEDYVGMIEPIDLIK